MSTPQSPQGFSVAPSSQPFLDLADIYDQRGEPKMRDRFLILAADAAFAAGQAQDAERLLQRLLQTSPHHMLKGYRTFAEAARAEPVRIYIADLRMNYPLDVVQNLLDSLRGRTVPVETIRVPTSPLGMPEPSEPVAAPEADRTALLPPSPGPGLRPAKLAPSADRSGPVPAPAPPPQAKPAPTAVPVPRAKLAPAVPPPSSPSRRRRTEAPRTSWLALFLTIVVFLAGLAWLGYALARPFLR